MSCLPSLHPKLRLDTLLAVRTAPPRLGVESGAPADQDGLTWKDAAYGDGAWPRGPGLLYAEGSSLPQPKRTPLTLGRITYYFRTTFNLAVETRRTRVMLSSRRSPAP